MYRISEICTQIGAHRYGESDVQIQWLLTDSRSLTFPETTLFFALRTPSGDGHRYIPELYRRGVRAFVVSEPPAGFGQYGDAVFLGVESPLKALARLAERHRDLFRLPVVGITGSNGKTVVKEWAYSLLMPFYNVTRSPRSYNSQIGVPLSVWLLDERTQIALFEAGISRPGEMEALRTIIQPTIGIFTNVGPAHQEGFESMAQKTREKLRLFQDVETLIYCAEDAEIRDAVQEALEPGAEVPLRGRQLSWSIHEAAGTPLVIRPESVEGNATRTRLIYIYRPTAESGRTARRGEVEIPFADAASIRNCSHCLALCLLLGLTDAQMQSRFPHLDPVGMRLEVMQGRDGLTLINDAYNSDLTSIDIALDFLARRKEISSAHAHSAQPEPSGEMPAAEATKCPSTFILSDVLQTGVPAQQLYAHIARLAVSHGVDRFVGIGTVIGSHRAAFGALPETHFFEDVDGFLDSDVFRGLQDEIVLVKGARTFGFERITEALTLRVHETTLDVNLASLAANVRHYRSFMRPETKMVCMVKASAYGMGAVEVARTLQDCGVDYLAVAVADEGAELRRAGITMGILVMNPEPSAFQTLFRYELEPEVYSFALLEGLILAARRSGITNFPIHLKLDTGMARLGFSPEQDLAALIDRLHHQKALLPRSVFSHFVGADSPDFDEFSARQFERFDRASRLLQAAFPHHILRHICNSAGIERFPERHLDMVRLGIGLYGIQPIAGEEPLRPVAALKTTILQIRNLQAGESVGYSRRTVVERPTRVAAIPIGYADGLRRALGNRHGYCLVQGQRAAYLGNICMDVAMIDVTDIPCREGDAVEIFGENLRAETLAEWLDTIPYEILTSVSPRVKRVYYQ